MNNNLRSQAQPNKIQILLTAGSAIAAYVVTMTVLYTLTHKVIFTLTFTNATAATYVVIWRKRHANSPLIAKIRKSWWRVSMDVLATILETIAIYLGASTIALLVKNALNAPSPIQSVTDEVPLAALATLSILVVPIGEEALMRGFVYPVMRQRFSAPVTITLSACLFALLHGNIVQIILTLPLGIACGYMYEQTHSLMQCIGIHMLFNAFTFITHTPTLSTLRVVETLATALIVSVLWVLLMHLDDSDIDRHRVFYSEK